MIIIKQYDCFLGNNSNIKLHKIKNVELKKLFPGK